MHEYDIALKNILTRPGAGLLARLMGCKVAQWHNSELSGVRSRRADLLGETWEGTLIHVELQSSNDPRMVYRMLDYAIAIESSFGQFPNQMVLYVGEAPLRMERRLESAGSRLSFECAIVDIRELDGEPLLSSASLEDNVIAVLARLSDRQRAVRTILTRIAAGDPANRAVAMAELTILDTDSSAFAAKVGLGSWSHASGCMSDARRCCENWRSTSPVTRRRPAS